MAYQSILVAIEPNQLAAAILSRAVAVGLNADLHVIYVAPSVEGEYETITAPSMIELIEAFTGDAQRWARREISTILANQKIEPNSIDISFGNPAEQIILAADELCCGLVVMGASNHKASLSLGSVADKVVRHAKCDVLTVSP